MKIRILVYGMSYNLGGVETYMMAQFRRFDRNEFKIDFVNTDPERKLVFSEEILNAGSEIYRLTDRRSWKSFLSENRGRYDFMVFNIIDPLFHPIGLCSREGGFRNVIVHSHNGSVDVPFACLRPFVEIGLAYERRKLASLPITRWACSRKASEWMFGKDKDYTFIRNGIDTEKFRFDPEIRNEVRKELGLKESDFVIGNIGRVVSQKNHPFLIRAFHEYSKRDPDAKLVLIGADMEKKFVEYLNEYIRDNHLEDKVMRLGVRKDSCRLYQAMDAFILPSRFEGLPVVGVEAECAGLPVLFSDTITQEVDLTDGCKYLPIFGDGAEGKWSDALSEAKKAKMDRSKAADTVREKGFDVETEIKRVAEIYRSMI